VSLFRSLIPKGTDLTKNVQLERLVCKFFENNFEKTDRCLLSILYLKSTALLSLFCRLLDVIQQYQKRAAEAETAAERVRSEWVSTHGDGDGDGASRESHAERESALDGQLYLLRLDAGLFVLQAAAAAAAYAAALSAQVAQHIRECAAMRNISITALQQVIEGVEGGVAIVTAFLQSSSKTTREVTSKSKFSWKLRMLSCRKIKLDWLVKFFVVGAMKLGIYSLLKPHFFFPSLVVCFESNQIYFR